MANIYVDGSFALIAAGEDESCSVSSGSLNILTANNVGGFDNTGAGDIIYISSDGDSNNGILGVYFILDKTGDNITLHKNCAIGTDTNIVTKFNVGLGTELVPYTSISHALYKANTGDTIWVKKSDGYIFDGHFTDTTNYGEPDFPIHFKVNRLPFNTGVVELLRGPMYFSDEGTEPENESKFRIVSVDKTSGSWGSDAAGYIYIATQARVFPATGNIKLSTGNAQQAIHDAQEDCWDYNPHISIKGYISTIGDLDIGSSLSGTDWPLIDGNNDDFPFITFDDYESNGNKDSGGYSIENLKMEKFKNSTFGAHQSGPSNYCFIALGVTGNNQDYLTWGHKIRNCWFVGQQVAGISDAGSTMVSSAFYVDHATDVLVEGCKFTGDFGESYGSAAQRGLIAFSHGMMSSFIIDNVVDTAGTMRFLNAQPGSQTPATILVSGALPSSVYVLYNRISIGIDGGGEVNANGECIITSNVSSLVAHNTIYVRNGATLTRGISMIQDGPTNSSAGGITQNYHSNIIIGVTTPINDSTVDWYPENLIKEYNCYTDNTEVGGVSADPMLVDPENGDLRLKSDSPCLNTGKPVAGGFTNIGAWQKKSIINQGGISGANRNL